MITILVFVLGWTISGCGVQPSSNSGGTASDTNAITRAFETKLSDVQVEGEGLVERILDDDNDGSRHQKFIVRLASGLTVLIVHNIDLAPRVDNLKKGDSIRFYGEYVWSSQGGKVHWTHHDPQGRHVAGWVKHNGRTYQ
jgi:Protein of unknown function (DUF3465)